MQDRHPLTRLFAANSVAVVGASEREHAIGMVVFRNLQNAGYAGRLYPVNPRHDAIFGVPAYKTLGEIGAPIDVAVICTAAATIPDILKQCGKCGIAGVILVTPYAGLAETGTRLERRTLKIARGLGIRVLGPDNAGILRPDIGLHAATAGPAVKAGRLALVTSSPALCSAMLDHAAKAETGFSSVIVTGAAKDIATPEILDYLASDPLTLGILLHLDRIDDARAFMSALRATTRTKPVVALRTTDANAPIDDAVLEAALRRAGAVRVRSLGEWLDAATILVRGRLTGGTQLAIVADDPASGALASTRAAERGLALASFATSTRKALAAAQGAGRTLEGAIQLSRDDTPYALRKTVEALLADDAVDVILSVLAAQAPTPPHKLSRVLTDAAAKTDKPMLAGWTGSSAGVAGRQLLRRHGIPAFETPEAAIDAFALLAEDFRQQARLRRIPTPTGLPPWREADGARLLIDAARQQGRTRLSCGERHAVLRSVGIDTPVVTRTQTPNEAIAAALQAGFPVILRADAAPSSPAATMTRRADSVGAVRAAFDALLAATRATTPEGTIDGLWVEADPDRPQAIMLQLSVRQDAHFGPTLRLGRADPWAPQALALLPLDRLQAQDLIASAHLPALTIGAALALEAVLLGVSLLCSQNASLDALDIGRLRIDALGALAAEIDITLAAETRQAPHPRPAIAPYPLHWVRDWVLPDGERITLRPIAPEDADIEQEFVRHLSDESKYYRFMDALRELTPATLIRFTQIDYAREMALLATIAEGKTERVIGVARYVVCADGETAEFALVVADAWQKRGIGRQLMAALIEEAQEKGIRRMVGDVLAMNAKMLRLAGALGFSSHPDPEDSTIQRISRALDV
ncbi:GNAT family N-acetyltransferase [Propionivibrio dicarboxylicus]|uniref:Acetyltransferase n=1 Tax=Propionivibrio dicarboxylicus TaxID=83767 RepID=A0A1G8C6B0_9RHOO|nr:GNAT family N-acetyltransferase [Propionivibrio dicarboxylicus]SDH40460.1 acetyltransferase [Propionivibrio dicarboxylicus]